MKSLSLVVWQQWQQQMNEFDEIKRLFGINYIDGFSLEEIRQHEKLCSTIPKVLHEYYFLFGRIKELNHSQDNLIAPNKLRFSSDGDYLVFYVENQYACVWAIRREDLKLDNPAVFTSINEIEWRREFDTLLDFLNAMANLQAVFSLPFNCNNYQLIDEKVFHFIKHSFKKKDYQFVHWIGIEFYGNSDNDVIAVMKNGIHFDLLYASGDKSQFEKINSTLSALATSPNR